MRLGIESWFKFESPEEKKRKQEEFEAKVYPLGPVFQKEWELSLLKELFPNKRSIRDEHFQLLVLRQSMLESVADHPEDETAYRNGAIRAWYERKTPHGLSSDTKKTLIAVAICENEAQSMEELPSAKTIRSLTGMIPF
jgi:hypothetical protein